MISSFAEWLTNSFAHPYFFTLLALIPFIIWWQVHNKRRDSPSLRLTTLRGIASSHTGIKAQLRPVLFVLRIFSLVALIIALARPHDSNSRKNIESEGIDIVMALDLSGSMLAEDFKPNRVEAAKAVAMKFVDDRPTDRIGLVVFASESFPMCPVTMEHGVLKEDIANLKVGMLEQQTGIGLGLASAVNLLRSSSGKSKIVILMTDGVNNVSVPVSPLTALEIAKLYKVRVYTIGIGTNAPYAMISMPTPNGVVKKPQPVEIDEALLSQISAQTGGKYFRATGNKSLEGVYKEIDKLEKTKVDISVNVKYNEKFFPFAMIAIICLVLELLLRYTVFRTIT
jgi:Ca-activated chloride channel homolog